MGKEEQKDEQVSQARERQHVQIDNDDNNFERQKTRSRVSFFSMLSNQPNSQSTNQASRSQPSSQPDQIKNQTIRKKKFYTSSTYQKTPIERKDSTCIPFLKQNGTCALASTLAPPVPATSHFGFEGGVGTTTPHVLKKINQPKNNKTIPTTAFPPVVFPLYIVMKTEK
jgi:hypothetical protein